MKRLPEILFECLLLLEYDRNKTINQHGEKALDRALSRENERDSYLSDVQGLSSGHTINKHPGTNREKAMHELMSQFEEADPTPQKKYVQHIARMYGNGGFNRHEDVFSRGKAALRDFHDLATRKIIPPEKRDIGRYKTLSDLEDTVAAHKEQTSSRQQDKAAHEIMKQPEHSTIEDHGTFTKIIPHTAEAAAHFGKGTKWCTATENTEDSMFHHYNSTGKLHIMIPKSPKYAGEKYQWWNAPEDSYDTRYGDTHTGDKTQLMDEQDEMAHDKLGRNHPEIMNHVMQYFNTAVNDSTKLAGLNHPEPWVRLNALKNHVPESTREQHTKHLLNDPNPTIRMTAADRLPDDDESPYHIATAAFKEDHKHLGINSFEQLDHLRHPGYQRAMIEHGPEELHYRIAAHPDIHPDVARDLLNHDDDDVRWHLADNKNAPSDVHEKLTKDQNGSVRSMAVASLLAKKVAKAPGRSQIKWHGK